MSDVKTKVPRKCAKCRKATGEDVLLKGHKCPYRSKKGEGSDKKEKDEKKRKADESNNDTVTKRSRTSSDGARISKKYTVTLRFPGGLVLQIRGDSPITKKQIVAIEALSNLDHFQ